MKTLLILILGGVTFAEVYQAVSTAQKWNSYESKIIASKENPCPDPQIIIQKVEYNPINDLNIDSFLQVYGITQENIHSKPLRKNAKVKSEILIEPKKIVPPKPNMFKIKITKTD